MKFHCGIEVCLFLSHHVCPSLAGTFHHMSFGLEFGSHIDEVVMYLVKGASHILVIQAATQSKTVTYNQATVTVERSQKLCLSQTLCWHVVTLHWRSFFPFIW